MRSRLIAGALVLALCSYSVIGCVVATRGRMPPLNAQTLTLLGKLLAAGFLNTDDGPV